MVDIIDLKSKPRDQIYKKYPPLGRSDVPQHYETRAIENKKEIIDQYDVVFWHRLLKTIYQEPLEIECELHKKNQAKKSPATAILRRLEEKSKWQILKTTEEYVKKIQSGEIVPFPVNWKYFIKLPSGGIIEIGTKDQHTVFYFAHVITRPLKNDDFKEAERLISLLLDEAKKVKSYLLNPIKEFEKTEGLKFYQLFNVYRANYVSAEFMLSMAMTEEKNLRDEFLKYDARNGDLYDEDKRQHVDLFMLACGTYFLSAITYFFMSLEGFINIVIHSFLKKKLRDSDLNIEQRFDIEQKLKLMTVLCDGFIQEHNDSTVEIYSKFLKLKKYRNSIFHSKVEESLKSLGFIEDGFLYNCEVRKYREQFLPSQKIWLSANDVIEVKGIVDDIIELIVTSMLEDVRLLTNKYILNSGHIPFFILNDGRLSMGTSDKMNFENFVHWLTTHLGERKPTATLGGNSKFNANIDVDGKSLFFEFGSRGKTGKLSYDKLKVIWDRHVSLGGRKNLTSEYTDPSWPETPDRILAPYAAALIRDFENNFQNH